MNQQYNQYNNNHYQNNNNRNMNMNQRNNILSGGLVSPFGFRNIKPMTREERRASLDRVEIERERLRNRFGYQAKLYKNEVPKNSSELVTMQPDGAGFITDSERFHTDVTGESKQEREHRLERKRQILENKRNNLINKENERWQKYEQELKQDEQYWQEQREKGIKAKANKGGSQWNLITLEYSDNIDGDQQRYYDDRMKYRAKMRTVSLIENGGTRAQYNILTGDNLSKPITPQPPQPSDELQKFINQKKEEERKREEELKQRILAGTQRTARKSTRLW